MEHVVERCGAGQHELVRVHDPLVGDLAQAVGRIVVTVRREPEVPVHVAVHARAAVLAGGGPAHVAASAHLVEVLDDGEAQTVGIVQAGRVHHQPVGEDRVSGAAGELDRLDRFLETVDGLGGRLGRDPVEGLLRGRIEQLGRRREDREAARVRGHVVEQGDAREFHHVLIHVRPEPRLALVRRSREDCVHAPVAPRAFDGTAHQRLQHVEHARMRRGRVDEGRIVPDPVPAPDVVRAVAVHPVRQAPDALADGGARPLVVRPWPRVPAHPVVVEVPAILHRPAIARVEPGGWVVPAHAGMHDGRLPPEEFAERREVRGRNEAALDDVPLCAELLDLFGRQSELVRAGRVEIGGKRQGAVGRGCRAEESGLRIAGRGSGDLVAGSGARRGHVASPERR